METKRTTVPEAEEILGKYFPVLDHGFISLVDYMGSDMDIEKAARVSYGLGTRKTSDTRHLLRYLRRHKHTTPSEMVELKFHCAMPIFVARQWIRTRTANVNEYSGRYSLMPMLFYTPTQDDLCYQNKKNNQGRAEPVTNDEYKQAIEAWQNNREKLVENYGWMTDNDFAKELARIDLPLSTYTFWYWKIDLHNLLHFLTLRVDKHAQKEIQVYGEIMAGMVKRLAPISYEAWIDYDVCGARFSRQEMEILTSPGALMVDERGLWAGDDGRATHLTKDNEIITSQLSSREIEELFAKLMPREKPDFELDLSIAKTPEYFMEKIKEAELSNLRAKKNE